MSKGINKELQQKRFIRREFWIGNIDWYSALDMLKQEYQYNHEEAISFLGDSTNLDQAAKDLARSIAVPFGVSLIHPSIML